MLCSNPPECRSGREQVYDHPAKAAHPPALFWQEPGSPLAAARPDAANGQADRTAAVIAVELFPDQASRTYLAANHLASFAALWSLDNGWYEAPNERRGGWSGVSRHVMSDGSAIFLKRQDNHLCRTWRHPIRGIPTFYREYRNILRLARHQIGTLEALYYGHRREAGHWQAILVTRALDSFSSLDEWNSSHVDSTPAQRRALITAIAQACARLHHHRLQHSCLYGKHIFVPRTTGMSGAYQEKDIRFIDLEKLRLGISRERVGAHDLDQLMRRTAGWSADERSVFQAAYRQQRDALKR